MARKEKRASESDVCRENLIPTIHDDENNENTLMNFNENQCLPSKNEPLCYETSSILQFNKYSNCSSSNFNYEYRPPVNHRYQKICLFILSFVNFTTFSSVSIIAPFYPKEASQKLMSETLSGMVFSTHGLVVVLTSPLIGKYLPILGTKFTLISGVLMTGSTNILFGFLDKLPPGLPFIVFSFVVRTFEATGAAAASTASYTYLMHLFPNNVGTAFGITETCIGLGMSLGPAIGGLLYSVGGYGLPFFVFGLLVLVNMPLCWFFLEQLEDTNISSSSDEIETQSTYKDLFKIPEVIVVCLIVWIASHGQAFLDPTIEPYFRIWFKAGPEIVGLAFLLMSAAYAIFSPIVGYFSSRTDRKLELMLIGMILFAIAFFFLAPASFTQLEPSLFLSCGAMILIGFSVTFAYIPTFETLILLALSKGLRDDTQTHGLVSGLWTSCYALGEVTGPTLGGFMVEKLDFHEASSFLGWITLAVAIVLLLTCILTKKRKALIKIERKEHLSSEERYMLITDGIDINSIKRRSITDGFTNKVKVILHQRFSLPDECNYFSEADERTYLLKRKLPKYERYRYGAHNFENSV